MIASINLLTEFLSPTDPLLARVGLSEGEAQRQGIEVRVAKLPMSAVLRTHTIDERQGFMKALVAARDDRILGFTMMGTGPSTRMIGAKNFPPAIPTSHPKFH